MIGHPPRHSVSCVIATNHTFGVYLSELQSTRTRLTFCMNAQCETAYGDPQLDLVYDDR